MNTICQTEKVTAMPEEVLKNLYRLSIPLVGNPLKELNAYLIKGSDRNLLIDTGFRQSACREALFAQMAELGLKPGDVDVLLTHLHSDHTGLAPDAAGDTRTIYISRRDQGAFASAEECQAYWSQAEQRFAAEGFPPQLIAKMASSNPARTMAPPNAVPHVCLEDGDVLEAGGYKLRAMLTPGHTPGHMCFWMEEQGAMLLGDHVLFDITPNITAWDDLPDALGAYLDSLRKIREYDVRLPLPAHRGRGDFRARIDQLLLHHRRRLDEALSAVKAHPGAPAYELAGYMTWQIRSRSNTWEDFPLAQKWFAVGECMSHLERLMAEGQVRREMENGVAAYYAV